MLQLNVIVTYIPLFEVLTSYVQYVTLCIFLYNLHSIVAWLVSAALQAYFTMNIYIIGYIIGYQYNICVEINSCCVLQQFCCLYYFHVTLW